MTEKNQPQKRYGRQIVDRQTFIKQKKIARPAKPKLNFASAISKKIVNLIASANKIFLAIGLVIMIALVWIMVSGHMLEFNKFLERNIADSNPALFGLGLPIDSKSYNWVMPMVDHLYGSMGIFIKLSWIIFPLMVLYGLLRLLASLGRNFLQSIGNFFHKDQLEVSLVTILVVWTIDILLAWVILIDNVSFSLMLIFLVIMLTNILLCWLELITNKNAKTLLSNQAYELKN